MVVSFRFAVLSQSFVKVSMFCFCKVENVNRFDITIKHYKTDFDSNL